MTGLNVFCLSIVLIVICDFNKIKTLERSSYNNSNTDKGDNSDEKKGYFKIVEKNEKQYDIKGFYHL